MSHTNTHALQVTAMRWYPLVVMECGGEGSRKRAARRRPVPDENTLTEQSRQATQVMHWLPLATRTGEGRAAVHSTWSPLWQVSFETRSDRLSTCRVVGVAPEEIWTTEVCSSTGTLRVGVEGAAAEDLGGLWAGLTTDAGCDAACLDEPDDVVVALVTSFLVLFALGGGVVADAGLFWPAAAVLSLDGASGDSLEDSASKLMGLGGGRLVFEEGVASGGTFSAEGAMSTVAAGGVAF